MAPKDGPLPEHKPDQKLIELVINKLKKDFPDRVSTAIATGKQFASDFSFHQVSPSDSVVTVYTSAGVSKIVQLCANHKIPIIPYGPALEIMKNLKRALDPLHVMNPKK